jgi:hypothetical protein
VADPPNDLLFELSHAVHGVVDRPKYARGRSRPSIPQCAPAYRRWSPFL